MRARKVMILIATILVVGNSSTNLAHAQSEEKLESLSEITWEVVPYWNHINRITTDLSAKGTTLYPYTYIKAIKTSGKISGKMDLERMFSGGWSSVSSWNINGTGSVLLSKSYLGISGGKYRVKVSVTVNGERVTRITAIKEI